MKKGKLMVAMFALGLGIFMAMLDGTIVNISIPSMMKDFGVGIGSISWVLDAYLLVLAVAALTMGKLADQFGRRRLYSFGLVVFTLSSLACALSWDINWLIAFRAVQGLGAATMISVSMAIMMASFPQEKRGMAMGAWAAIGITAAAVGPSLGGVIVEYLNWNWVFYINVPIGVLALILMLIGVAETRDPVSTKRLDVAGMIFFSVSMFALVLAIIKGQDWAWGSAPIVSLFAVAAVFLAFFVLWERRQEQPMLQIGVFKSVTFSSAVICQALVGFGMVGAMFLLTMFLQNVLGYSVLKAAVSITPIPATALVFSPIGGRVCDKIGTRIPTVIGLVLLGLGLWSFSQLKVDTEMGAVAWRAVLVGAGMGLSNPALAVAAMGAAKDGREGVSSGVLNTSRFIGMTLGIAICTALLTGAVTSHLTEAKAEVQAMVTANQQIPASAKGIILEQLNQLGQGDNAMSAPDFAAIAKEKGMPESMIPQLEQMVAPILADIRQHVTGAFNDTYPWAALVVFVGIIPGLLLSKPKDGVPAGAALMGGVG